MPNAVARVLTPLQVGIVLILLGVGSSCSYADPGPKFPCA